MAFCYNEIIGQYRALLLLSHVGLVSVLLEVATGLCITSLFQTDLFYPCYRLLSPNLTQTMTTYDLPTSRPCLPTTKNGHTNMGVRLWLPSGLPYFTRFSQGSHNPISCQAIISTVKSDYKGNWSLLEKSFRVHSHNSRTACKIVFRLSFLTYFWLLLIFRIWPQK